MSDLLHTRTVGDDDAATVVFLHGLFGQGRNWNEIAKQLPSGWRGLMIDLPNHGHSPWTEDFSYLQMADQTAETIRAKTTGPVVVVGHSMGGKVAMQLALRHPDLVRALVVVDISPSSATSSFDVYVEAMRSIDLTAITSRGEADQAMTDLVPSATVRGFLLQNLRREGQGWRWQQNLDLLGGSLDQIGDWPATDGSYPGPVLWVAGDQSDYITEADREPMEALFPAVRLTTIKQAGHWVHSEQPAIFVQVLRAFLSEV
ncbi:alpha/beta fold hydrolase [Parenemella sanctibonifatiensis]|uniref:Alpha/beta hydrolase n=1 Tax=Parenemella sanctibonifatiensis TaxID=2016505 RepID=A0A255EAS0_9ACTN|nr:alpha/beta fold hydrolase [Parenemella sanctibonifatiensis]OYN86595.1 alpha/beta hydrolase [Parenemella sanctibonifatiensis]